MSEDDKVLLYELNETYTNGFTYGYNRGFLDGMEMMDRLYNDEKVVKMLRRNDDETR